MFRFLGHSSQTQAFTWVCYGEFKGARIKVTISLDVLQDLSHSPQVSSVTFNQNRARIAAIVSRKLDSLDTIPENISITTADISK
ncbi:MAG: hypothetical protein ACTSWQ_10485 [Candidatus Thorarchaeota archaeon]